MTVPTLDIRDLRLGFKTWEAYVEVLHGISLHIRPGERVALVGESGSGKSVTARIVLGLLQVLRSARISGRVVFEGRDLDRLSARERQRLRGTRMTMVFQDPTSSLNPVYRIGTQFHEVLRREDPRISESAARERAAAMLSEVSIEDPDRVFQSYPFQLSGGMNQRVMIAMALANEPSLLIADEPGTALDVTVQAQTLELMRELVRRHHTSVLFISHNLGVVRESGAGKSTVANLILAVYPPTSGTILMHGEALPARRRREHRRAIQLVQQNPLSTLNPKRTIGASLRLALDVHRIGERRERPEIVAALLEEVGLPAELARRYPAALSGGQRQRVSVARALACRSELVVLDEPTSSLDVLVQARVLRLLEELRRRRGLTYLFITHDLSVVRNFAERVAVFEKGRLIEIGDTEAIFAAPEHAYTRRLISAVPVVSREEEAIRDRLLPGRAPSMSARAQPGSGGHGGPPPSALSHTRGVHR